MLSRIHRTWSVEYGLFESDGVPYRQVPIFSNKSNMRRNTFRGVGALQPGILGLNDLSNFVGNALKNVQNLVSGYLIGKSLSSATRVT